MAAKFGTSGLRGLVEDILDGTCERHVRAYLKHLVSSDQAKEGDKVYVGRDFRPSSPEIAEQTYLAIEMEGFIAINCGEIPTPALANYAMKNGCASIMITGSHIPADRNGIKFYRKDGEIDKHDEQAISTFASEIPLTNPKITKAISVPDEREDAVTLFRDRYLNLFDKSSFQSKRIGIYEHSSVARDILHDLLSEYGAEVISLGRSDHFIPVDTEAVSEETQHALLKWTHEHELDAIVSTDGDADRPLLSDERGTCIKGDVLGYMTSTYLGAKVIATPISSNSGIKSERDIKVLNTRVGSPYVIEAMNSALDQGSTHVVGFEANGGFLQASALSINDQNLAALPTRDCVLPILACLAKAFENGQKISEMVADCQLPATHAGRIQNFPTHLSQKLVADLINNQKIRDEFFAPIGKVEKIDTTDGVRLTLEGGKIVHLRASGNAPEMRCYVEAASFEDATELVDRVVGQIKLPQ